MYYRLYNLHPNTYRLDRRVHLSQVTRNPVFVVSDQVRLKPACSASEASNSLEILDKKYRYNTI